MVGVTCVFIQMQNSIASSKIERSPWLYHTIEHTILKQLISCRGKNEKVCEMFKNEKCTCTACKTVVFHYQICKYVTFLLPSSRDEWIVHENSYSLFSNCP